MAVNRLWYPDRMLSRSRSSPTSCQRLPGAVESCLQWPDTMPQSRSVVRTKVTTTTTTKSEERSDVETGEHPPHHPPPYPQHHHHHQPQCQRQNTCEIQRSTSGHGGRRTPYDASQVHQAGNHCPYRCRTACRHLADSTVTSRPCCHLSTQRCTKSCSQFSSPWSAEQTTWSTVDGRCMEEDDVIDAVHKVAGSDPSSTLVRVGDRFTEKQRYTGLPPRPPRSALRRPTPGSRRFVEVHEDEQGRPVDLTVVRPVTPQITSTVSSSTLPTLSGKRWVEVRQDETGQPVDLTVYRPVTPQVAVEAPHSSIPSAGEAQTKRWVEVEHDEHGRPVDMTVYRPVAPQVKSSFPTAFTESRRWVEVREDDHGRTVDLTVVRPSSPQTNRNLRSLGNRVEFAPEPYSRTTCNPCSRPTSTWPARARTRSPPPHDLRMTSGIRPMETETSHEDEDAARQALLAIYQAGKPDMMFHTRAPSSAALEKMLTALSDNKIRHPDDAAMAVRKFDSLTGGRNNPYYGAGDHRYLAGNEVMDDEKPVKVKVECPRSTDTLVSFRVQSKAA